MIPLKSIKNIVDGYQLLEKDLASSNIDKKLFAAKSKEYSNISEIIKEARAYLNFEKNKIDLEKIINDEKSDKEMIELANSELKELLKQNNENEFIGNFGGFLPMTNKLKQSLIIQTGIRYLSVIQELMLDQVRLQYLQNNGQEN